MTTASETRWQDVREYVADLQAQNPSVGACRRLALDVATWLVNTAGFADDAVTVHQSYFRGEAGNAEHFYVTVETDKFDRPVVVDPTITQFVEANWHEGKADTYVAPAEIPDVGVITPDMTVYDRYE